MLNAILLSIAFIAVLCAATQAAATLAYILMIPIRATVVYIREKRK